MRASAESASNDQSPSSFSVRTAPVGRVGTRAKLDVLAGCARENEDRTSSEPSAERPARVERVVTKVVP